MKRDCVRLAAISGFVAVLCLPSTTWAQTVGNASSFAIVGGGAVNANGAGSTVNGNVGIDPAAATFITGFPGNATITAPYINHGNDALSIAAAASVQTLYDSAAMAPGAPATPLDLTTGGVLGSNNYVPGKYTTVAGVATIPVGQSINLTTPGQYIFTVSANLTALGSVNLGVGVDPCDVWWRTPTGAAISANFRGNVVSNAVIALNPNASLSGRALTTDAGSVTLAGNNSVGGCAGAPPPCVIVISPAALANGTVGVPYSATVTGSLGTAPYTFTVPAGTLPVGLTMSSAGVFSGTPTDAVPQTFTVTATDAASCTTARAYTVFITDSGVTPPPAGCPPGLALSPTSLPNAAVGIFYSQTITGSGGTAPFTFTKTGGGPLPSGLTLSTSGVLEGTPANLGFYDFIIRGTDAAFCFVEVQYAMSILTSVPTLPQAFFILLAAGLAAAGYKRLVGRARRA